MHKIKDQINRLVSLLDAKDYEQASKCAGVIHALVEKKRIQAARISQQPLIEKRALVTAEQLRELFDYSKETGHFHRRKRTTGRGAKNPIAGTTSKEGYVTITIAHRPYKAHRLAWLYVYGEWPRGVIDHINGIGDDNRIANLRDTSQIGNCHNRANKKSYGASGIVGAHKSSDGKWRAQIIRYGLPIDLGTFPTEQEAALAYRAAKLNLDLPGQKSPV